jgi:hypothetical protein
MQYLNKIFIVVVIINIWFFSKALGNDTIKITFLNRSIDSDSSDVHSFIYGKTTYIIKQLNDSCLECFILKRKKLICYGLLNIFTEKNQKIAKRQGYWFFLIKNREYSKDFFYNDKIVITPQIKTTQKINDFPPPEVIEL